MKEKELYWKMMRYALDPEAGMPKGMEDADWERLFRFADEQAIGGVMFEGVKRVRERLEVMGDGLLKDEGLEAKRQEVMDLVLEWGIWAMQIEEMNKVMNRRCVEVMRELREAGFECCILKGQGNALLYPNPYRRNPGDIDVWVMPKLKIENGKLKIGQNIREVREFLRTRKPNIDARFRYHHVTYQEEDGISIELHYLPSLMNTPIYNCRLQKWFREQADKEDIWHHDVTLPDTEGGVSIPTWNFNVVYQLAHMMHHFFDEGIGLRQMMDYYFLLRSNRLEVMGYGLLKGEKWENILRYLGLWKFTGAVMYVMRDVFHLEEQDLIAPVDERRGKTLLREILKGGNFGQHSGLTDHSTAGKYFAKHWRNLQFVREYPAEAICEPFFRTWHFFWRLAN